MKLNRRCIYNVGSITSRGRFAVLRYSKRVHTDDASLFDRWINGPNTYYRVGRLALRVRKDD